MEFLRLIHGYQFNSGLAQLFPTPYALATLVLFVWSIAPAVKMRIGGGFMLWLRVTWVLTLLPAVTGVILALGGAKVPSATDAGEGVSKYGFPVDPSRDWEHWMYAGLCVISLYVIEVLVRGRLIEHRVGLRLLPVATLFLYGCAYMIGRVAVFPGSTPGS
ncbi:hypothetical protein ACMT4L_11585 [Deinococcus sp. A31D244]|uniref:Uncharacterized protein n=1 Tax=Deinococcus aquaticus TaxID=328692 RepID=A0ABY7V0X5_9DEIO|nr:hypothetical protein [Deinococcus aquaticus]WDA58832.1 hypothetical protein M8445_01030 [Deinococcus aquaticus]